MKRFQKIYDLSKSQIEILVDDWIIGTNAERNRQIIKERLIEGTTYEDLAFKHHLSTQAVKALVYKGLQRIIRGI